MNKLIEGGIFVTMIGVTPAATYLLTQKNKNTTTSVKPSSKTEKSPAAASDDVPNRVGAECTSSCDGPNRQTE